MSDEIQVNVRAWIESLWKFASALGAIVGAICLSWMALKYATREELQQERDVRNQQVIELGRVFTQQINEIGRALDRLADQKEINSEFRKAINEMKDAQRERGAAYNGKVLDNRNLGRP